VLQLALSRELLKARRPELISTVGHRGRVASDPKVQRLDTLKKWFMIEWEEEIPEVP
jgi:hypothetical protein